MPDFKVADGLARVDLFSSLSRRDLNRIVRTGRAVDFTPSKEIVTQGRAGVAFHLVLSGVADIEVNGQHRRQLTAGDYFGEISLLDGKPRSATVRAGDEGLRTFTVTAWEFRSLLRDAPQIAQVLLTTLCARLREAEESGKH